MAKFFLSLVAIGVAVLIGAIVFATFRVRDPFLSRPQSLCAAPSDPSNPLVINRYGQPGPVSNNPAG
jgi:hypothetical protein